jgi:hypothetical protein
MSLRVMRFRILTLYICIEYDMSNVENRTGHIMRDTFSVNGPLVSHVPIVCTYNIGYCALKIVTSVFQASDVC